MPMQQQRGSGAGEGGDAAAAAAAATGAVLLEPITARAMAGSEKGTPNPTEPPNAHNSSIERKKFTPKGGGAGDGGAAVGREGPAARKAPRLMRGFRYDLMGGQKGQRVSSTYPFWCRSAA
jgi:hypothetical protein